ncbi:hypothetical protein [Streptomyces sp. NPDC093598]|uniref:hypothetical protein n=1 Tax=Streptomyces sp. NPDC093598 TaxID=3366046 RepID=UPI003802C192
MTAMITAGTRADEQRRRFEERASRSVNEVLAGVDAAVKRLDRGVAREAESAQGVLLE